MADNQPGDGFPRWLRWTAPRTWWGIFLVTVVPVVVFTAGALTVLLLTIDVTNNATARIELVKTGLAVGAGIAGLAALALASRRQWSTEHTARATEHDATERRITELYTKAADQLGSAQAPVRLAGLYALERLAQSNSPQRQTVANVLCAYLRMPFHIPGEPPVEDADERLIGVYRERVQEREVRMTAQRLLADHLRPGNLDVPVVTFWNDITVDLTGATLVDFDLNSCTMLQANFGGAQFSGPARFDGAQFNGLARFEGTRFNGPAEFLETHFSDAARFRGAQFISGAQFTRAQFSADAGFDIVRFYSVAAFPEARFNGGAGFCGAEFNDNAKFGGAEFNGDAWFGELQYATPDGAQILRSNAFGVAQFGGDASFGAARFKTLAGFGQARFSGIAGFGQVQFTGPAGFGGTQFSGPAGFIGTHFRDSTSFSKALFSDDARFDEARFSGDAQFDGTQFSGPTNFKETQFERERPPQIASLQEPAGRELDDKI